MEHGIRTTVLPRTGTKAAADAGGPLSLACTNRDSADSPTSGRGLFAHRARKSQAKYLTCAPPSTMHRTCRQHVRWLSEPQARYLEPRPGAHHGLGPRHGRAATTCRGFTRPEALDFPWTGLLEERSARASKRTKCQSPEDPGARRACDVSRAMSAKVRGSG